MYQQEENFEKQLSDTKAKYETKIRIKEESI
jgi:hypothetical protein